MSLQTLAMFSRKQNLDENHCPKGKKMRISQEASHQVIHREERNTVTLDYKNVYYELGTLHMLSYSKEGYGNKSPTPILTAL